MSSKEQFRQALKRSKHATVDSLDKIEGLKKEIDRLTIEVRSLQWDIKEKDDLIFALYKILEKTRRWYQIFIKIPIEL